MRQTALVLLSFLSALGPPSAAAQADVGVFAIRRNGTEVGREAFRIIPARPGRSGGDSIIGITRFPSLRPTLETVTTSERNPSGNTTWQLGRRENGRTTQVVAGTAKNRVTVRLIDPVGESAREYAGGEGLVLLDDSVFALYQQIVPLTAEGGRRLTALFPRSGRRLTFQAERDGERRIRLSGGLTGEIELGSDGKLQRIILPELGFEAVRLPD